MNTEVPVQLNGQYDIEALRLNDDGDAVGQVHGFTVFVPGLLPGEQGTVQIVGVDKRFARARLLHRRGHGTDRANPECAVFGACGGCQLQHMTYAAQLRHKQTVVENALHRIGSLQSIEVRPTLGADSPLRYRNQVQVPVRFDGKGGVQMGFYQPRSHDLVETKVCALEPEDMERMVERSAQIIASRLGASAAKIHHLIARKSFATGDLMLTLVAVEPLPDSQALGATLQKETGVHSVCLTVQPRIGGPVWGPKVEVLAGPGVIQEELNGLWFEVSPRSFFQVNTMQAKRLVQTAIALSDVSPNDHVLDAYCGTGTLGLHFAKHAAKVAGVEVIADAIADARVNAQRNGLANAEFHVGKVESLVPKWIQAGKRFDLVVVDPPRKGCDAAVLAALAEGKPERIVYVSCNPVTLARDLARLYLEGYRADVVQPVDMFPNTSHVECVVAIHRADRTRE